MVLEERLNKWAQESVKGPVLAAVAHRRTNTFLILEKALIPQSSETRLNLHICFWYRYITPSTSKEEDSIEIKTCFLKGKTDQVQFDSGAELETELAFSKDEDLLFCKINEKVYGRPHLTAVAYLDIKAATAFSATKKPIIITFFQLLTFVPTLQMDCFQCHPQFNYVIGILSNSFGKLLVLEISVSEGSIELRSVKEPVYAIDLGKVGSW
jgi:hypothetical protein